jgi:hypothetical protein
MSKVEAVCPFCREPNAIERSGFADRHGLQNIQCSYCSKQWAENLGDTGRVVKSAPAPSSELAALRVQVRAQMDELLGKIKGLLQQREAVSRRFRPNGVEKSDVAQQELTQGPLAAVNRETC